MSKFPANFRRIRLELAREPNHPEGDHAFGYTLVAPLDAEDRIDSAQWKASKELCRVVRFRPDGSQETGHLNHGQGETWKFLYDKVEHEEAGFKLGTEQIKIGEYVSIRSEDGMHTYKVSSVEPL